MANDALLADATRRCETLRDRLRDRAAAGAVDAAERAALRAEIAALIRIADAQVDAWRTLADGARALPELWKQVPVTLGPSAPGPSAPDISVRSDHLGASTFVARGWSAYAAADYAAAEEAFARALALAPDELETVGLLAWALAAAGRDDDALAAAQRVLAGQGRGPAGSLARVAVGRVCLSKRIVGEAIEHLARVVRDDDDRRATLYATLYLGVAYRHREMFEDSTAFLRRALALGPNLVEARYELGVTHWRAGAHAEARAEWRTGAADAYSPWARRCREQIEASGAEVGTGA